MSNNMQNLKIYDIIDQLEDLIENSPKPKLSGSATKRTVDVEEVFDLLGDLKTTIPEDIRRANSLMIEAQNTIDSANDTAQETIDAANTKADAIVAEAQNKANLVLEKAREEYERLIAEDEIYQEAQKRAQLLAAKAEYNANEVFENAKTYADDILADSRKVPRRVQESGQRKSQGSGRKGESSHSRTAYTAVHTALKAGNERR